MHVSALYNVTDLACFIDLDVILPNIIILYINLIPYSPLQMDMFLTCGHLRSAYVVAVHVGDRPWVERVKEAALSIGQNHVASMCDKWIIAKEKELQMQI